MIIKHLSKSLDVVGEIAVALYNEWPEIYANLSKIHSVEDLETILRLKYTQQKEPAGYVLYNDANEWIGFLSLEQNNEEMFKDHEFLKYRQFLLWVTNLYIKPEYRKLGYASSLIENLCKLYKRKYKIDHFVLWIHKLSVAPFYEKNEFNKIDMKTVEGFNMHIFHRFTTPPEPWLKAEHFAGLIVVIVLIYALKITISFIKHLLSF